jgi:CubicO group peptidase (beta-lactamase class C family)
MKTLPWSPLLPVWVLLFPVLVASAGCSVAGQAAGLDAASEAAMEAAAGAPHADEADVADAAELQSFVRGYADRRMFMGAVLVSRKGVLLLDQAYGHANLEWEVPHTAASKFRIGSMTKQFTAAAILLLQEQGKLQVEDPLSKYLADVPPAWSGITLHHLLTHTSGIPDLVLFPDYPTLRTQPSPPEKTYLLLRTKPLDFAPGQKFQYSNSGYVVLALVIERLTGKSYDAFMQERIFGPLALNDTGNDAHRPLLKNRADGYVPLTPGTPPDPATRVVYRNADFIDMSVPTGGGSMYSTTGDLRRWVNALFGGQLLSPASLAQMTTPHVGGYGYGLFVQDRAGVQRISHGGSVHGFLSTMTYYRESDVLVIVLSNTTAGDWLNEIVARVEAIATRLSGSDGGTDAGPSDGGP